MAKILLADDSTHAQRMGSKILSAEGHQVTTVSNGQAALQALQQAVPDLVVADIFMPGRNGYELCHFIKSDERLKSIPVLLIIGAMEPYDPDEGKKSGADGLITKPLESSTLVSTVKDLLAAATRFAPSRAHVAPKEELAEVVEVEKQQIEETPQWDEQAEEEIIAAAQPEALVIPNDMNQQPVGMLADLLPQEDAPASLVEPPSPEIAIPEAAPAMEIAPEVETSVPASLSAPAAEPPITTWTAEPAPLTPEEEKLFQQPAANWEDLTQLVEQTSRQDLGVEAETFTVPDLVVASPAIVAAPEPELESFDTLSAVTAKQPVAAQALAPAQPLGAFPQAPDAVAAAEALAPDVPAPLPWALPVDEAPAENVSLPGSSLAMPVSEKDTESAPVAASAEPPAQLVTEDAIREAVQELLPEIVDRIVERVKQSLKS